MSSATVFVDDAVLGRLPHVCVKTGVPTDDTLTVTRGVDSGTGLGVAWLLVLAGPLGWIGLFLIASFRNQNVITVRLPYSGSQFAIFDQARRTRRWAGIATFVLAVAAAGSVFTLTLAGRAVAAVLFIAALGALGTFCGEALRVRRALVDVRLDGSRRWVYLGRVSDAFGRAAAEALETSHQRQV